mmetsp:Transcript_26534/g.66767  ORF Transcript_26534/g.66767 Transcript_26534/m.66767 type:complete len:940 (-) Transcript_26534:58-2877(-)
MEKFSETRFRRKMEKALSTVRKVLENERHPEVPADVDHEYRDKFSLADVLSQTYVGAMLNSLQSLGLDRAKLEELYEKAEQGKRAVTLRLTSEEKCAFDREETRKVDSDTQHVTTWKGAIGGMISRATKTVTKVTEYFWHFRVHYELFAFVGSKPTDKVSLLSRSAKYTIVTRSKSTPRPEVSILPSIDCNISALLKQALTGAAFTIDRDDEQCRTPRRNPQVDAQLNLAAAYYVWARSVHAYFAERLFPVQTDHGLDLAAINAEAVFVPVFPTFERYTELRSEKPAAASSSSSSASPSSSSSSSAAEAAEAPSSRLVLQPHDIELFLAEQLRSLEEQKTVVAKSLPDAKKAKLISSQEGSLMVALLHGKDVCQHYADGVDYVEEMLRQQLIAALGKVVGPVEFANYMEYHYRKLYRGEFEPRLFSYAVRRPDHYPEGVLSIEAELADGSLPQPIRTVVRRREAGAKPMRFAINAATDVSFFGERYLHAWMSHQFSGQSGTQLNLVARARQFSSFILLVGRISSAEVFDPKAAIIIRNKDDLKLPLMLETIPSAKEFKDAIASLSPEQQRFAKAFRGMQLESTLFGICVIQIKPQLEKLLNLPNDGLTKEIKLTQNLMELFITYQIPSDLLSYDGDQAVSLAGKLTKVKGYVQAMYDMINECKAKELAEKQQEAEYARAQRIREAEEQMSIQLVSRRRKSSREMCERSIVSRDCVSRSSSVVSNTSAPLMARAPPRPAARAASPPSNAPTPVVAEVPQPSPSTESTPSADAITGAAEPESSEDLAEGLVDYTQVPQQLEQQFEKLDKEGALRPTIINPGKTWRKKAQKALLAKPTESVLNKEGQKEERNQAYDLLDALSRSGCLAVDEASLHVVVAATHCFDKTLVDTVVQDNVNPIEKVERSSLIMAATVQERAPVELIKPSQVERVRTYSPELFGEL